MKMKGLTQTTMPQRHQSTEVRREGRLCRIVNVASGASLDLSEGHVINYMIGTSPNKAMIKMWRLISMGPGYALRAVEDTPIPRYLAPTSDGALPGKLVTLSTFPVFWELSKTDEFGKSEDATGPDMGEEWTCTIRWPFFDNQARVLDMEEFGRGSKVFVQPFREQRHERCQFWRIQFLDEAPAYTPGPNLPVLTTTSGSSYSNVTAEDDLTLEIESGAKYIIQNVKGNTVITQSTTDPTYKSLFGRVCSGIDGQKWEALNRGKGWVFKNAQNRHFMSITQDPADGTNVVSSLYEGLLWDVQPHHSEECPGEIVYSLVLRGTDYCATLSGMGQSEDRTNVVLWKSWNGPNQLWKFDKVG